MKLEMEQKALERLHRKSQIKISFYYGTFPSLFLTPSLARLMIVARRNFIYLPYLSPASVEHSS